MLKKRAEIDKGSNFVNVGFMSRLTIEIDPEQHRKIKTLATFAGMTLKEFILDKTLASKTSIEDTTEKLLASPSNAARLRQALASPDSANRVFESIEDLQDALGV